MGKDGSTKRITMEGKKIVYDCGRKQSKYNYQYLNIYVYVLYVHGAASIQSYCTHNMSFTNESTIILE